MQTQRGTRSAALAVCLGCSVAWAAGDAPRARAQADAGAARRSEALQVTYPGVKLQPVEDWERAHPLRFYALIGGGADGYTGGIHHNVKGAPVVGLTLGGRSRYVGGEIGYTVAPIETRSPFPEGLHGGADLVRNSVQGAANVGLLMRRFEPFLLAGAGVDFYTLRTPEAANPGFRSDAVFYVPVGVGVRYNPGRIFAVDLRYLYNFLIDEKFVPGNPEGGRTGGLLSVGGKF